MPDGHLTASQAQHRDGRQGRQQRRQREQDGVVGTQVLLATDNPCLIAGPANHQVALGARRLDRFDDLDRPHDPAPEPATDLLDGPVLIDPPAAEPAQGNQVQTADGDADHCQKRVVGKHHGHEEDQGQEADGRGCQFSGDEPGHTLRADDPAHDVAGEPVLKESHGQPEHMLEELDRLGERQPNLQPREVNLLEADSGQPHDRRDCHGEEQRLEPGKTALDQDLVDEQPLEGCRDQRGNHKGEPRQDHECERGLRRGQPARQANRSTGPSSLPYKLGPRSECERDLTVEPCEFLSAYGAPAASRIIQEDDAAAKALDDQEMIPLPEHHERRLPRLQTLGRLAECLGFQAVLLGRFLDVKGVAAVTRDPAVIAQYVQGHVPAVVLQNDPQRGRPTLDGLHLQEHRSTDRPVFPLGPSEHT